MTTTFISCQLGGWMAKSIGFHFKNQCSNVIAHSICMSTIIDHTHIVYGNYMFIVYVYTLSLIFKILNQINNNKILKSKRIKNQ
jgi:hypothetical protein